MGLGRREAKEKKEETVGVMMRRIWRMTGTKRGPREPVEAVVAEGGELLLRLLRRDRRAGGGRRRGRREWG